MRVARSLTARPDLKAIGTLARWAPGLTLLASGVISPAPALAQSVTWMQRLVSGPSARAFHGMAGDTARGVVVLFGGATDRFTPLGETWEWNGGVNGGIGAWTLRSPAESPAPRGGHSMAYDSGRGVTVLFGGTSDGLTARADTWEWDGAAWTQRSPSAHPPARNSAAMGYDASRHITLLFGGTTPTDPNFGDTWAWDGSAAGGVGTWTLLATTGPSPRGGVSMAYDTDHQGMVLFGGFNNSGVDLGDTWVWNGSAWSQRMVSGPPPRSWHSMAFDAARHVTVLFGGWNGDTSNGETWEWDAAAAGGAGSWTRRQIPGPSARGAQRMAYAPSGTGGGGQVVLFGGWSGLGGPNSNSDTWVLALGCGPADADGNGRVEPADISLFVNTWYDSLINGALAGDFDGNGAVEPADIAAFVGTWFSAVSMGC